MKTPGKINYTVFFLVCFIVIARCDFVSAQLSFQKTYNLRSETVTISQPDGNGGVVTAGNYRGEQGNNDLKISLTNFDKNGKVTWSKYYRWPGGNLRLMSFILAENGDYIVAGYKTTTSDPSIYKIFLLRVNKNGEILWTKNYSKDYSTIFYSLGRASDKGFFIYAHHNDAPAGLGYNIVIKVDENGEVIWTNRYQSTWKWGTATATKDGGLVISNITSVYKIDKDGKVVWAKEFKATGGRDVGIIRELSDEGILLIVNPSPNKDGFLFKLDKNGNFLWAKGYKEYSYQNIDVVHRPSGNLLLSGGGIVNASPSQPQSLLFELNTNGEILKVIYLKNKFTLPHIVSSGNNLFIGGKDQNSMLALAKLNLNPGGCTDTSGVQSSTAPAIVESAIVVNQNEISFLEEELPIITFNLELQEDTLCYECKKPELNLGNDTTLCAEEKLTLGPEINDVNYEWSTGEKTAAIKIEKAGIYWLKITNECGTATDTITINYNKEPEFKTKISQLAANPWDEIYFSDSTVGIKNRYWDFGDSTYSESPKAAHIYVKNGNYEVKLLLEDSSGCRYSIIKNIKVRFESLYLPNAFSPDGNGLNDTFGLIGYGIENYRFKIYNRWGELVFDKANTGWDGKLNGSNCPAGMYLYMLEAVFEKKKINRHGYFYLER